MACCGNQRQSFQSPAPIRSEPAPPSTRRSTASGPPRRSVVTFEYFGKTGLTVVGPISGNEYRFDRPGARVSVDIRDRRPVAAVPNLREVELE